MRGTIGVEGGRVRVTDTGGDGAALVLFHGDWTDSAIWARLAPMLRDGFRVITYDEPGFGDSPPPVYSYTRAGNLRAVLDRLQIERAALVAHSGGADPALGFALDEPGRVTALVLVAPGTRDHPWPDDDPYSAEFARFEALGDRGGLVALGLRTWVAADAAADAAAGPRPTGISRIARAQFRRATGAWPRTAVLEADGPPVYERLGDLAVRTTVVVGELEYAMVRRCADDIASRIPDANLEIVPGCDHMLPLRAPDKLAQIINDTVTRGRAASARGR